MTLLTRVGVRRVSLDQYSSRVDGNVYLLVAVFLDDTREGGEEGEEDEALAGRARFLGAMVAMFGATTRELRPCSFGVASGVRNLHPSIYRLRVVRSIERCSA